MVVSEDDVFILFVNLRKGSNKVAAVASDTVEIFVNRPCVNSNPHCVIIMECSDRVAAELH